jgi:hypothetical protein
LGLCLSDQFPRMPTRIAATVVTKGMGLFQSCHKARPYMKIGNT